MYIKLPHFGLNLQQLVVLCCSAISKVNNFEDSHVNPACMCLGKCKFETTAAVSAISQKNKARDTQHNNDRKEVSELVIIVLIVL